MSLINLGSKVAFEAMISLATVALMSTYITSIGCVLLKRLRGETLPSARWSLGRCGLAVNAMALVYTCWSVSEYPGSCQTNPELSAEKSSQVLLGFLALHLQSRQQYLQLGMSSFPAVYRVCAAGVSLSCTAYIPGASNYHRCIHHVKEVADEKGKTSL